MEVTSIIKRDGRTVPFDPSKISDSIFKAVLEVGGTDRKTADGLARKVALLINSSYGKGAIPGVEEIQDIVEKVLVENGHYKTAKAYILYRAEHARLREQKDTRIVVDDNIPYKILWQVFKWNVDHDCDTIEKLNKHIKDGTFGGLVKESEKLYLEELGKAADKILKNRKQIKIVIVAGPSSSGKTTTTMKIGELLKKSKAEFVLLNLDNYFRNLEEHPKDEYGDYDFETPQALDLPLINDHLIKLMNGETIEMPYYNFKTGKRKLNATEFKLLPGQIILIDSLHGLYPEITSKVPHDAKFKFYIESLCQVRDSGGEFVRWTDLRMLRRMVRDSWHRGYNPDQTVGHWHYVRRAEKKHIVPFINNADYVFNGALAYELPVYKRYLFNAFPGIIDKFEKDPKKLDALMRAKRAFKLLGEAEEVKDESVIPKNSLVREFIGGSSYEY